MEYYVAQVLVHATDRRDAANRATRGEGERFVLDVHELADSAVAGVVAEAFVRLYRDLVMGESRLACPGEQARVPAGPAPEEQARVRSDAVTVPDFERVRVRR
jgi:hypothetical protein